MLQYKCVWYRPARASFWAELADDTGTTPTPREQALKSLDQNFYGIAVNLNANAIVVRLGDDDGFWSQYGGGFPYDPLNRPKPEFAVAQESLVAVADKYALKVIFVIDPSTYHKEIDDNFGNEGTPEGSFNFLQSVVDPTVFYGFGLNTTKLEIVGLANRSVHTFVDDNRIAAWFLSGQWILTGQFPWHNAYLSKYWSWFYDMIHYAGATSSFVGMYAQGNPEDGADDPECSASRLGGAIDLPIDRINSFKSFFAAEVAKPDMYGVEWYGNGSYRLSCIGPDVRTLVRTMRDSVYPVPTSQIIVMEGGTNQTSQPPDQISAFYTDAINAAADVDGVATAGISVWNSDGNVNDPAGIECTSGDHAAQALWALNVVSPIAIDGCRSYPIPPVGWHDPGNNLYTETYPAAYGLTYYSDLTISGYAVATAFAASVTTFNTDVIELGIHNPGS